MIQRMVLGRFLVLIAVLGVQACGASSTDEPNQCSAKAGSMTDLSVEPSYSASYFHRWSIEGCPVRLDVLMTREARCLPEDLLMGSPLGPTSEGANARIYVRGDTLALGGGAAGFQGDATLPAEATDTGFRQGARELWTIPNDDSVVFIRSSSTGLTEAWPLERSQLGCI